MTTFPLHTQETSASSVSSDSSTSLASTSASWTSASTSSSTTIFFFFAFFFFAFGFSSTTSYCDSSIGSPVSSRNGLVLTSNLPSELTLLPVASTCTEVPSFFHLMKYPSSSMWLPSLSISLPSASTSLLFSSTNLNFFKKMFSGRVESRVSEPEIR